MLDRIAEPGDVFLTQFECELSTTFDLIRYAHELGLYTMVNPSPSATMTTGLLASVDVLCLNEIEFADLFGEGKISPLADPEAAVQKVLASGVATAVLTLGSKGPSLPTHTTCTSRNVTAWTPWTLPVQATRL